MEALVYISDFRLPFVLNFIRPLKRFPQYRKILVIERENLQQEEVLEPYFDEIRFIDRLEARDQIAHHVEEIRQTHSIAALLTPGENAIEIGGEIRSAYGIPGLQKNQALAVRNKWIMKQMLQQRGIRTARAVVAMNIGDYEDFIEKNGFPVIVKPLSGFGTINTFKISDAQELRNYIRDFRRNGQRDLLEEFITGREFHCDSIVSAGEVVFSSVSQYLFNCLDIATQGKPPASITIPDGSGLEHVDLIRDINRRAISALGINNSVTHAELFLTAEGEVVFGEIGARIGGAQVMPPCIRNTHGIDLFDAISELELGLYEPKRRTPSDQFTGMVCFPSRSGIIQKISQKEDYADVEGLLDFNVSYRIGQEAGDVRDTMTRSGYAIVEGRDFETLRETLLDMYHRFEIQVMAPEPV
ncbi:ATP-grasp domain-containing protein [Paenibacillus glufosinatiresistens]|uniref:ATP-grasp domain-containing protein n=1 Tax=Paenibacillus glufosinatiresistens TaxID=3070657 RepID=UPI00286E20D0|nr:ATP-grasp domain-containing protein [Paenibacillus sp. YX.27]